MRPFCQSPRKAERGVFDSLKNFFDFIEKVSD